MTTGTTPALAAPTAPTPADVAPAVNPVDARTALALLGLPNAYELDTPALNAAAARALEAARGCDLTTAEAARIMRTNRQAVEAMCRTGLLPAYQLPDNGHWRIPPHRLRHHPRPPQPRPHSTRTHHRSRPALAPQPTPQQDNQQDDPRASQQRGGLTQASRSDHHNATPNHLHPRQHTQLLPPHGRPPGRPRQFRTT